MQQYQILHVTRSPAKSDSRTLHKAFVMYISIALHFEL